MGRRFVGEESKKAFFGEEGVLRIGSKTSVVKGNKRRNCFVPQQNQGGAEKQWGNVRHATKV